MKSSEFDTLADAAAYRKQHGGWLFVGGTATWWFDAAVYTPSQILASAQTRGVSGELVCDNRHA